MKKDDCKYNNCQVLQFNNNNYSKLEEVVICEENFHLSYICTYNGTKWEGEKALYAYPSDIEALALGHIILDCLPLYDKDFTYAIKQEDKHYSLVLEAKDKSIKQIPPIAIKGDEIIQIMEKILSNQGKWQSSGCFHCATLYHPITKEFIIAEDIGRHNCVDRLKGLCLQRNIAIEEYFLFITARITASIYKKIRRAGISTIISKSAITGVSLETAKKDDCTLIGFCRYDKKSDSGRFNIYNQAKNFTLQDIS